MCSKVSLKLEDTGHGHLHLFLIILELLHRFLPFLERHECIWINLHSDLELVHLLLQFLGLILAVLHSLRYDDHALLVGLQHLL